MSMSIMLEESGVARRGNLSARMALLVARRLTKLPPQRLCRVLTKVGRGARSSRMNEAQAIRAAVCRASIRASGMECLERSVAVYLMCRVRGHVPVWCTGFRVDPFAAHAWIEVDSVPVNEPAEIGSYVRATVVDLRMVAP